MNIFLALAIIFICLLLEGIFSGSEIAMVSADQIKLRHDAAKGSRGAKLAIDMLQKPEWLLSTTLVGTNIAVVTNTTITTALTISLFGEEHSWLAIVLSAPLIWIFGEVVPKSVFQHCADAITPRAIFFLRFCSLLFYPLLIVFSGLSGVFNRVFGGQAQNPFTLRNEIITMVQMPNKDGDIQHVEKNMIQRVFDFSETCARDVMVPLIDVVAIDRSDSCGRAVRLAAEKSHVRLPVYDERIDRVMGVLNSLELLGVDPQQSLAPFIRPVRYVPGNIGIKDLLLDLRKDGNTVAVVVDEFGGAEGLITIEDIMEEVVEEMEDEYDIGETTQQWVKKMSERDYIVSARIEIDNLEEELNINLPKGKYVTLAGYLLERSGQIPTIGTVIKAAGVAFTIQKATPQMIQEVRIRW
ncbi:MAG: hemolysin family protein [Desulfobacterales bacterium]|nr:hemolysin family protein [Desulfobacterales bacterium]